MLEESIAGDRRNSPDDDSMVAAGPIADAAEDSRFGPFLLGVRTFDSDQCNLPSLPSIFYCLQRAW